ncbi:NUDIX hydrolase [Kutzneria sp. NPDC052558]|uniref:NUDIX hydrolase n=1 Tax=Kutzneria sp. NPDC052558 TaxID=3364121 RepID=UPI0037CA07E4
MSDYIKELRGLVGTRPLILPGTSVVVTDARGRLLLVKRADTGDWGLPGGFMEPGESFEQAGRREVMEETGLEIGPMRLLDVFSGPEYYYRYPHGDEVFNVTAAYVASCLGDAVPTADPGELRGAAFFEPTDLPRELLPPERPIIACYLARFGPDGRG